MRILPQQGGGAMTFIWSDGHDRVAVHLDSLRTRLTGGWRQFEVDLEPMLERRRSVRFAFSDGVNADGDTVFARVTIDGDGIAEGCREDVQATLLEALA
jgi:hypothetical protein